VTTQVRSLGGKRKRGFTLIEILVGVAILAVLSAALTPLVIKYVNDGRRARALSDSQAIGQAILAFQLDTGLWPVNGDANPFDAGEISRLVGLPSPIVAASIPGGTGTAGNWAGGGSGGTAASLQDHLIRNQSPTQNPIYPVSASAPEPPGWNGPYLKQIPLDPWGRPYVCNVRYLDGARVTTAAAEDDHAVLCLSAGPNAVYDTPFDDATQLQAPLGDDVGWAIQGDQTP
jgi:prepilin-type N-terminal cleavage/methylation domain-containing protein